MVRVARSCFLAQDDLEAIGGGAAVIEEVPPSHVFSIHNNVGEDQDDVPDAYAPVSYPGLTDHFPPIV
jgi:hypothetical protein